MDIYSSFTIVNCPICRRSFTKQLEKGGISQHLQIEHAGEEIKPYIVAVSLRLGLKLPDNIDKLSREEQCIYLDSICQYEQTTLELRRLRHQTRTKGE